MRNIKNKELFMSGVVKLFEQEQSISNNEINIEEIKNLLSDIEIESATNKIQRAAASRVLKVTTDKPELEEQATEIENRFSDIKFNRIINHLLEARYYGYSCFEIVYNEDFTINSLVPVPTDKLIYKKGGWKLKIGNKEIELTREKFLLNIHRWTPATPTGQSIVKNCIKAFLDKEMFEEQLRGLAKKYGDVIIVYPFDEKMDEEEARKLGQSIKEAKGKNAIGVPVSRHQSLKDSFEFIKLSDLDPMIYQALHEKQKEKLLQNILGSTLVMNSESSSGKGTQALGKVHQDGFDEVVQEVCNFCTDSLYQLIQIDSLFYGYDYKNFEWSLSKVLTEKEKREIEKEEEELRAKKAENLTKLNAVGYELEPVYLAEYLGFDPTKVLKKKDDDIIEFSDTSDKVSRTIESANYYKSYLDSKIDKLTENLSKQIKKQVSEIDPTNAGIKINIDYSELEDDLILGRLKGYADNRAITLGTAIDEFDPFNMKFEEAIKSFNDKTPIDFNKIEEITEEVRANAFWLKRSTDLEITNRLYKTLNQAITKGESFETWLGNSKDIIDKAGLGNSGYYLETIFRTNMQSAYAAGNYKQQMEVADYYPYWEYKAIEDERTSSICQSLDGTIKKHDDAFWGAYYPPNHFNCRSTVVCRNMKEIKENGLKVSKKKINVDVGTFKGNPAKKYWSMLEKNVAKKEIQLKDNIKEFKKLNKQPQLNIPKLKNVLGDENYNEYRKMISKNKDIENLYRKYGKIAEFKEVKKGGHYDYMDKKVVFEYTSENYIKNGKNKYSTLAHEFGHHVDFNADVSKLTFKEIDAIRNAGINPKYRFTKLASSSDEFLTAIMEDKAVLKETFDEIRDELLSTDATAGVQDAIDGMLNYRGKGLVRWGHGARYYNDDYNYLKRIKKVQMLKETYVSLGYSSVSMAKVKELCRNYTTAMEIWANIASAATTNELELEAVKKYLPNSYKTFKEIIKKI